MARARWVWTWTLTLACGGEGALELPEDLSGFPTLVRVETDGTNAYAYVAASDDAILREPVTPGFELAFLLYSEDLSELGLVAGRVFPNDGRFKTPDGAQLLEAVEQGASSWRALPTRKLPAWLEPYRLAGQCRPPRVKPINLPPASGTSFSGQVAGVAPIDDEHVLVTTFAARFYRARWQDDGVPTVSEVAVAGEREVAIGGFRSASRLWFGGVRGLLGSIDLEASRDTSELYVERRSILPPNASEIGKAIIDIDGDPERDDDIFMLTYDGSVLHFDGLTLSELGQIAGTRTSTRNASLFDTRAIRWRGRHQAVAVAGVEAGAYPIYEFEVGATPRPLILPEGAAPSPTAVAYGSAGLFVATTARSGARRGSSQVWLLPPRATEWTLFTEVSFATLGLSMERYDGLAVGVAGSFSSGTVAPQREGTGEECASIPASSPLRDLVRVGPNASVAVGHSFFGEANQLLWFR